MVMSYNVAEYVVGLHFMAYKIVKIADLSQTIFVWSTNVTNHTHTHT